MRNEYRAKKYSSLDVCMDYLVGYEYPSILVSCPMFLKKSHLHGDHKLTGHLEA